MGLDIYTYTAEQRESNDAYDKAYNSLWDNYGHLYDTDKEAFDVKKAELVGDMDYTHVDHVPSKKYPAHLFNRRYLRSSYNDSGFDSAVPVFTGDPAHTLGGIFAGTPWLSEPEEDNYPGGTLDRSAIPFLTDTVIPRAQAVAEALRNADGLTTTFISPNPFIDSSEYPKSQEEAVEVARKVLSRSTSFDSFATREGTFFTKGFEILAALPGQSLFGEKGVYLIFKASDEGRDSYTQSAEIVIEFVEELIELINKDGSAYVSWSG